MVRAGGYTVFDCTRPITGLDPRSGVEKYMRQLSVCMPSNRSFEASYRAIETALAFCEAHDATLIVSDNSRDLEKANYWRNRSKYMTYLDDAPPAQAANARYLFLAVETPFLIPIGDDDELHADPAHTPLDLSALPPDVIGVKPIIEIFVPGRDFNVRRAFGLEGETPGLRLRQFFERNQGDNTAFYSAFRSAIYLELFEFFNACHPTRGSYCDWQLAMSLFVAGKLILDPSILYRYNAVAWATQEAIDMSARKLYTDAGLPENFRHYAPMLRAMDVFAFSARNLGRLSRQDVVELQSGEICDLFNYGFSQIIENSGEGKPELVGTAQKGLREGNPTLKFLHGAAALDGFQPGLKAKYIAFLKSASA